MISSTLHAIAKLPLPRFAAPELPPSLDLNKNEAWYESLLKIYDPIKESLSLKNALDKKNAFLNLRKQHQTRHDFCRYPIGFLANNKTRLLLGK